MSRSTTKKMMARHITERMKRMNVTARWVAFRLPNRLQPREIDTFLTHAQFIDERLLFDIAAVLDLDFAFSVEPK